MLPQPEIYLHDLSPSEKEKLAAIARRNLRTKALLFLPPTLVAAAALVYINMNKYQLGLDEKENLHGAVNVVLVIIVALFARILVSQIISLNKESKAWQKRVIQGEVHGKKGRTVYVGKQTVKLDAAHAAAVNIGDKVEISISTHAEFIIGVVKRTD